MGLADNEFPDEETIKKQEYSSFKLTEVQEKNLAEIEMELKEKKIHPDNKDEVLDYLENLYSDISKIKEAEYSYEGEQNFNINRYLQRIKKLISEIEKL